MMSCNKRNYSASQLVETIKRSMMVVCGQNANGFRLSALGTISKEGFV